MSLRWRIMGATVLVIVLTVLISIGVGYYTTQSRLGVFVDAIGDDEAKQLARNLSVEYTAAGSWETVDRPLSEAGYSYADALQREESEGSEGESFELFHRDPIRVVIVGSDGRVVKDNLSELTSGTIAPKLDGHRETVFDLSTNRPVGHVYVDVDHEFLATETHSFLNALLYTHRCRWRADRWHCSTAGRLAIPTYHGTRDGTHKGNPGNCSGRDDPATGRILR